VTKSAGTSEEQYQHNKQVLLTIIARRYFKQETDNNDNDQKHRAFDMHRTCTKLDRAYAKVIPIKFVHKDEEDVFYLCSNPVGPGT